MNIYTSFSAHLKHTRTKGNLAYIRVIIAACYLIVSHAWPCLLPTAPPIHRNEEVSRETMADYRTGSVHSPDTRPARPWWDARSSVIVGPRPLISDQQEGDRCLSHEPGGGLQLCKFDWETTEIMVCVCMIERPKAFGVIITPVKYGKCKYIPVVQTGWLASHRQNIRDWKTSSFLLASF